MLTRVHNRLYAWYYRVYYYLVGKDRLESPRLISQPPARSIPCELVMDNPGQRHGNFLLCSFPVARARRWTFFRRQFAYKDPRSGQWFALPAMTPWWFDQRSNNRQTLYGLNSEFVGPRLDHIARAEFRTWE